MFYQLTKQTFSFALCSSKHQLIEALISTRQTTFCICLALLLVTMPAYAVKNFKVSGFGGGHQIWFEAEDFDARDSDQSYKLAKAEAGIDIPADTFGDAITDVAGSDAIWLRYDFDISKAGGKGGEWYFWGRIISPNNQSDFLWVLGDDGNEIPTAKPGDIDQADDRVLEETVAPNYGWVKTDHSEGHTKNLRDGQNTMVLFWRQSDNTDLFDVFMWTDKSDYVPTDDDYKSAQLGTQGGTPVTPADKLANVWGQIKLAR